MAICENCGQEHDGSYGSGRFCNSKCARGFSTKSKRAEINETLSKKYTGIGWGNCKKKAPVKRVCPICLVEHYYDRLTCSDKCRYLLKGQQNKGRTGGAKPGSGRSKSGYYKGIYCGSTYELVYVVFNLDHNINFSRFEGHIPLPNNGKYFPDFIENKTIVEIKGIDLHNEMPMKIASSIAAGYTIKVLYKEDLAEHFAWVKENYHYKQLSELYDEYKPKYSYICKTCGEKFESDEKDRKCCSRECAWACPKEKGKLFSLERKALLRLINLGKTHTEEAKQKMRDAWVLRKLNGNK